jgi:hypothetical protein
MKDILKTVGSIIIISSIFVLGVSFYSAIPDVHVSHSTNECVTVINYTDEDTYSCENMPTKYNKVWVK